MWGVTELVIACLSFEKNVQELGSIETVQGRCIAFPNIYQHQVQPFRLEDPTKPGFRKIFVAFLVDPTYTIPSATIIAPQQREIIRDAMLTVDNSWLGRLPVELIDVISGGNDGTMSRAEAEAYRLQIMNERTKFARKNDSGYFGANSTFFLSGPPPSPTRAEIPEPSASAFRRLIVSAYLRLSLKLVSSPISKLRNTRRILFSKAYAAGQGNVKKRPSNRKLCTPANKFFVWVAHTQTFGFTVFPSIASEGESITAHDFCEIAILMATAVHCAY